MDRDVQNVLATVEKALGCLRDAILASDTRGAASHSDQSMALIDEALNTIKSSFSTSDTSQEANLVAAAAAALNLAWLAAEKVALGTNLDEMRDRIIDVKANVDHADAYLRAAIGWIEE